MHFLRRAKLVFEVWCTACALCLIFSSFFSWLTTTVKLRHGAIGEWPRHLASFIGMSSQRKKLESIGNCPSLLSSSWADLHVGGIIDADEFGVDIARSHVVGGWGWTCLVESFWDDILRRSLTDGVVFEGEDGVSGCPYRLTGSWQLCRHYP